MAPAFVTGGARFVGGRLIERLVRDGWTVAARNVLRARRAAGVARAVHVSTEDGMRELRDAPAS
jgi:nucleoside-diphosphate-sugar epimerase